MRAESQLPARRASSPFCLYRSKVSHEMSGMDESCARKWRVNKLCAAPPVGDMTNRAVDRPKAQGQNDPAKPPVAMQDKESQEKNSETQKKAKRYPMLAPCRGAKPVRVRRLWQPRMFVERIGHMA